MIRCVASSFLVGLIAASAAGQSNLPSTRPLALDSRIETLEMAQGISGSPTCDSSGGIYYQRPASPAAVSLNDPIVGVSADGKKSVIFAADKPELRDADTMAFTVSAEGEVLTAVRKNSRTYVLRFRRNGSLSGVTEVSSPILVRNIAVLSSQLFLLSGLLPQASSEESKPRNLVVDVDGKTVRELKLSGDVNLAKLDKTVIPFVSAVNADDGNTYLARYDTREAVIYVISGFGEYVRKLRVVPPMKNGIPSTFGIVGSTLLMEFYTEEKPDQPYLRMFELIDLNTSEHLATYSAGDDLQGIFLCYSKRGLAFVVPNSHHRFDLVNAIMK